MPMKIKIEARATTFEQRLQDRLTKAGDLRCNVHGDGVVAVTITDFENGWFDSRWTTCCEQLTQQAVSIVGNRR
jgi:hypothetical protein